MYSGSVFCPILLHILNNALSVIMLVLSNYVSPEICDFLYISIAAVLLLLSICVFLFMSKKNPSLFEFKFKEKVLTAGRKAGLLIFSFSTLIFITFSLSIAISSAFM